MDAAELTNEWYFDVIMLSKYKMQSSTLPTETMIGQPKTEEEIHTHFSNYINMMLTSARNWSMADFSANKIYEREGKSYLGIIHDDRRSFRIDFIEMGNANEVNAPTEPEVDAEPTAETESNKKPWWKVW
jgi:Tol biopolymer transport system component